MQYIKIVILIFLFTGYLNAQTDVFQEEHSIEYIISLVGTDNLSVYQRNDIIHFVKYKDMIIIISEVSEHYVAVMSFEEAKSFCYWVLIYPLKKKDINYSNHYYQNLIKEKIWE